MGRRTFVWLITPALLITALAPAAIASASGPSFTPKRNTYLTRYLTDRDPSLGVFRGVYAEFRFKDFLAEDTADDAGAVVV